MVGTWNKNQLKAETSKFYYISLFIFQTFFLRPQYSFKCNGWILRWRLQNFNRNWYDDLFDLILHLTNCSRNFFHMISYDPKNEIVSGSDLVNLGAKWVLISAWSVSRESDPSTTSLLSPICVLVLLPAWTQTRSEVEISGESSGKIFWSISTYVSLVTVTVMLVKCQGASQWDHWINSCWNSAGVIEEFSRHIRNCIVAWGKMFEK